ncbi:MAG: gliding motility-associated C-terminal domain-containing protein, partial [bacterium]
TRTIAAGGSADFILSIVPEGSFADPVTLDITPEVPGITAVFVPTIFSYPAQSILTLTASDDIEPRQDVYSITGSAAGLVRARTVQLIIAGGPRIWPNPFTPNGDGFNDGVRFVLQGMELTAPVLKIFRFNGKEVYTANTFNGVEFYWNGRNDDGELMLPGVYLYLIRESGLEIASGSLVLAR